MISKVTGLSLVENEGHDILEMFKDLARNDPPCGDHSQEFWRYAMLQAVAEIQRLRSIT